jgi:hypothetical protein
MGSALAAAAAAGGFFFSAADAADHGRMAVANNTEINPSLRVFLEINENFMSYLPHQC